MSANPCKPCDLGTDIEITPEMVADGVKIYDDWLDVWDNYSGAEPSDSQVEELVEAIIRRTMEKLGSKMER